MSRTFTNTSIINTLWLENQTGQIHIVLSTKATFSHGYVIRPLNQDIGVTFLDSLIDSSLKRLMDYINSSGLQFLGRYEDLDMESFIEERLPKLAPGELNIAYSKSNRGSPKKDYVFQNLNQDWAAYNRENAQESPEGPYY